MKTLLQLFNNGLRAPASDERPDHLKGESELTACGWDLVTLPMNAFPLNPLARAHNAYGGLDLVRAVRVLLTQRRVTCICGHMESVVAVLMLRRLFGYKPKIVIWEVPWAAGWRYREKVAREALTRADMSVVFNSSQVALVRREFGDTVPVTVIPFCVDVEFFRPAAEGPTGAGYVYSVGRDGGRDFQIVVDAMAGTAWEVVLRTAAPVRIAAADGHHVQVIDKHVDWQRYRELYAQAAVVVVAAQETMHASGVTSLLEAMAMGKAVVVTGTESLSDYLPPDVAGVVVPVGDADALRRAVVALMEDPARRERLGRRAREIAVERYSPAVHFRAVAHMLDRVVG